jgi:orotidine-5'-phosphate decarboxylase
VLTHLGIALAANAGSVSNQYKSSSGVKTFNMTDNNRIIVALDYGNAADALNMADQLDPARCRLKVGKELFTREGPGMVTQLQNRGFELFLDLKFHDIPNTVAAACSAAADLGVWMVNVHALGGQRMMDSARKVIDAHNHKTLLIAVTILTSMTTEDLGQIGISDTPEEMVLRLAKLANESGLDGVVCSAQEVNTLSKVITDKFLFVTPGVRPEGSDAGDQRRVMTPESAIKSGASYLVIGRPITQAADPLSAFDKIWQQVKNTTA